MNKTIKLIFILIILVILALLIRPYAVRNTPQNNEEISATSTPTAKESMLPYANSAQGISFEYPSSLVVTENNFGATSSPQFSVVLMKKADKENLDASSSTPREGPTAITVEVYDNSTNLSANDFAVAKTNWNLASSATSSVMVGGKEGVMYTWSGLYEGSSVVITQGMRAYVFSVTWMSTEDQLIKDFVMMLNTVTVI